jgi:hypothetical protein
MLSFSSIKYSCLLYAGFCISNFPRVGIRRPLFDVELNSRSCGLSSAVTNDDTQNPAVNQEEAKRGKPKAGEEGTDAEKLELVTLLQPGSLGDYPEQQS